MRASYDCTSRARVSVVRLVTDTRRRENEEVHITSGTAHAAVERGARLPVLVCARGRALSNVLKTMWMLTVPMTPQCTGTQRLCTDRSCIRVRLLSKKQKHLCAISYSTRKHIIVVSGRGSEPVHVAKPRLNLFVLIAEIFSNLKASLREILPRILLVHFLQESQCARNVHATLLALLHCCLLLRMHISLKEHVVSVAFWKSKR